MYVLSLCCIVDVRKIEGGLATRDYNACSIYTFGEVKVQHCQYNHTALHCAYSSMSNNVPELVRQLSSPAGQHIAAQTEMPCTPATNVAMSANSTSLNRYNL